MFYRGGSGMSIGYEFKNKNLIKTALTHTSYAHDMGMEVNNQRLEFLGDSVLSFIVADYLYEKFSVYDEGHLTELRAAVVCERSLAAAARKMKLGSELRLGGSERACGGGEKASILADTYEAVLGAIFLDGGIECARKWVFETLGDTIEGAENIDIHNYKSELQIYFQKRDHNRETVSYRLKKRIGPDHAPSFVSEAVYRGKAIGEGKGGNLKKSEQAAAKDALSRIGKVGTRREVN